MFLCFWFQIYAGFSGTIVMDQIYLMMYNMMWTAIPPMVVGALDQVAPDHVLESQPSLYSQGRLGNCII